MSDSRLLFGGATSRTGADVARHSASRTRPIERLRKIDDRELEGQPVMIDPGSGPVYQW